MNRIVKRGAALGLSLMLGVIGSVGVANHRSYSAAVVKAAFTENEQKAAAGVVDILDYESNTSAAEFAVNDIAGFEKIAELVNSGKETFTGKTITLMADLKYDKSVENNHNVIGDYDHEFDGIFDGGFHTISGIHLNSDLRCVGLFGRTGLNGKISKIILEDSNIISQGSSTSDTYFAGGIVGGPCEAVVSECISEKNVEVTGGRNTDTGGIVGDMYANISKCINLSLVKGMGCSGGIAGCINSDGKIKECINYGMIYSNNDTMGVRIGGICGLSNGDTVECCNMGDVLAENKVLSTPCGIGGIAGTSEKVINCYNTGQIIGADRLYAGGIVGTSNGSDRIIKNGYSTGEVKNGYPGAITSVCSSRIWELTNCYWLTGTAPDGVCETGRGAWASDGIQDTSSVFEYSREQMASQDFVNELNENCKNMGYDEVWEPDDKGINYGYPVLKNVPYTVEELTNFNFNGFECKIMDGGTIGILKYHEDGSNVALVVPAEIDGRSVTNILEGAFADCTGLTEITIPDSVTEIGTGAFQGCTGLKEILIPQELTTIGNSVFSGCTGLTKITIPDSVTAIGNSAFAQCSSLKEISIPNSVTTIEQDAFSGCSSLTDVYYDGTKKQWNEVQIASGSGLEDERITIHFNKEDETENIYECRILEDDTIEIVKYNGSDSILHIPEQIEERRVTRIGEAAFSGCTSLTEAVVPSGVTSIGGSAFSGCTNLVKIDLPDGITDIEGNAFLNCTGLKEVKIPGSIDRIHDSTFAGCTGLAKLCIPSNITDVSMNAFSGCSGLTEVEIQNGVINIEDGAFSFCTALREIHIPVSVDSIGEGAFEACDSLEDAYYSGTKGQWGKIKIDAAGNEKLLSANIHFKDSPIVLPEEPAQPEVRDPKQELDSLKSNGSFQLGEFTHYLTEEQIGIMENYLYTWLAQVNYAYQYSGSSALKELVMKKAGIDPDGDFASGMEQAITHISVTTPYGTKTLEITMGIGKPDSSGNLYPGYSVMHYEILEKSGIPSDVPVSGQIVRNHYADMGAFVESVKQASEDSLHSVYQWQQLEDEVTAGILVDKTVSEIVGNKNGSFSDGTFTIYAKPLFAYSKIVKISCPVDVHVYGMDGKEAGSIVNNQASGGNQNVRLDVDGDTKTVYLAGNDYYLNLHGTDTGTMKYEVEEIANEEVRRNVQFLELQLKKDMQYEGYVFRPLNIDRDLYALRTVEKDGTGGEVFHSDQDSYQSSFKKVEGLSLSQKNTSLESDRTIQLSASYFPLDASNPNLRWTTDNASIVRVDENGMITAVGSGQAKVTVSTKDGSFLKQYCVIDVTEKSSENGTGGNTGNGSGNNGGNGTGSNGSGSGSNGNGSTDSGTGGNNGNPGNSSGSGNGTGSSPGGNGSGGSSNGNDSGSSTTGGQDQTTVVVSLHYVLQFQANGGTNLSRRTMTLLADDNPGIMPKVQRRDYLFDGWYTKQEGGAQVTGDEPLKEAATLYARWTKAEAPAKVSALALKSKKKGQLQASFQKVKGASGYQVSYSGSKKFTSAKTKEAGAEVKTKTVTGLKAGKKYYVRVRAYCLDSAGNRIYGAYSAVKSVKVKS